MSLQEPYKIAAIKAIIVDDHDPIRKAMRRILAKMGIRHIVECFDGSDALKELARQPDIDLVLCDIYMRKVNGFEVLRYIRNRPIRADIPIIIVTGEANKDDIVKASDIGADDYIIKPFQAEAMEAKVEMVLQKFFSPPPLLAKLREGDRYLLAKHYNVALDHYKEALRLDPESKRARHSLAIGLWHTRQVEQAIAMLNENIAQSESYYKNFATLADIHISRKEFASAMAALHKELSYNPKQPTRQNLLAKLLFKTGDIEGALHHFREALKEDSRNYEALLGSGQAIAKSHDLVKAIYYFKRLRRYYPNDSRPLAAIVKYALAEASPKKAEAALKEENRAHPERLDTYLYLAKLYMATNHLDAAKEVLEALFLLQKGHGDGLKLKAAIAMKEKNFETALSVLQEATQKEPDLESYLAQAECLQELKNFPDSIHALHRALSLNPQHPGVLYLLAQSYKKTQQVTKALILYQAAGKAGANPAKCQQNIKLCSEYIAQRRQSLAKISA